MQAIPSGMGDGWHVFDQGATIGQPGSERGTIIKDEEHVQGARITLERAGETAPFSITCGIYGYFYHTAFAGDESEGGQMYARMKQQLVSILDSPEDRVLDRIRIFVDTF